ncbi:MAG: alpha/beta fold hydrolase [Mycobacteriales bacterium]
MVAIGVLGPLVVARDDGGSIAVDRPAQRRLLGALCVRAGRTATSEWLGSAIWDGAAPADARGSLQAHVSKLRLAVGRDVVVTDPHGYRLSPTCDLDAARFEALFADARSAFLDDRYEMAEGALSAALELWRGAAFEEFADAEFVTAEAARLEEIRLTCLEDLHDVRLAVGRHRESLADLEVLTRSHPFRERVWALRIVALYRAQRQSEALEAYRTIRDRLADELGVEPGGELRELHQAVLRQDPSLGSGRYRSASASVSAAPVRIARPASPPQVQYVRSGDAHLAYQVVGDGGRDVLYLPSYLSHVELNWEWPGYRQFLTGLSDIGRLIVFDKRGMGLSDRVPWADRAGRVCDALTVLDAVDAERVLVFGSSEGAAVAVDLAADHPERVSGIVVFGAAPALQRDDYPIGTPVARYELTIANAYAEWGTGRSLERFAPSAAADPQARDWYGRLERHALSPGALVEMMQTAIAMDYRPQLGRVRCPTLVLHRRDEVVPLAGGRFIADAIPHSRLQELAGRDHLVCFGDVDAVLQATTDFASQVVFAR